MNKLGFLMVSALVALQVLPASAQSSDYLRLLHSIALPDVGGRIDHLAIDVERGHLFFAALGNDTVEVIDLRAGRCSSRLEHLSGPQGVTYARDIDRVFVASGKGNRVDAFSDRLASPIGHVDALEERR